LQGAHNLSKNPRPFSRRQACIACFADFLTGMAAGIYAVEVEDHDFAYALYSGDPSNGSSTQVASIREGRIGYRLWATRTGRINPSAEDRYDQSRRGRAHSLTPDEYRVSLAAPSPRIRRGLRLRGPLGGETITVPGGARALQRTPFQKSVARDFPNLRSSSRIYRELTASC